MGFSYIPELIDTLWNVNKHWFKGFLDSDAGINRYIMECKCIYQFACVAPQWELIDTLWNVNYVDKVCFHREGSRN